jgi:hypothetical protein
LNLKAKIFFLLFAGFACSSKAVSQDSISTSSRPLTLSFGGSLDGEISADKLLTDSLLFIYSSDKSRLVITGSTINEYRVLGFNLTVLCNGIVLNYFQDNSGTKLTKQMSEAIRKVHPGCRIVFDKIRYARYTKEYSYYSLNEATLKFILK